MKPPVRIFISYSKEDKKYLTKLTQHLALHERKGEIRVWYDEKLIPGVWKQQVQEELESSEIILFLLSSDFLASNEIWDNVVTPVLQRHKKGRVTPIPVILRSCSWEHSPLGQNFTATPQNGNPVKSYENQDDAWKEVVQFVINEVNRLRGAHTISTSFESGLPDLDGEAISLPDEVKEWAQYIEELEEKYKISNLWNSSEKRKSFLEYVRALFERGALDKCLEGGRNDVDCLADKLDMAWHSEKACYYFRIFIEVALFKAVYDVLFRYEYFNKEEKSIKSLLKYDYFGYTKSVSTDSQGILFRKQRHEKKWNELRMYLDLIFTLPEDPHKEVGEINRHIKSLINGLEDAFQENINNGKTLAVGRIKDTPIRFMNVERISGLLNSLFDDIFDLYKIHLTPMIYEKIKGKEFVSIPDFSNPPLLKEDINIDSIR